MARYGEGDKRWIVEDRADGTNVHNWHWAETNCLEWSKALFTTLLADLTLLDGEGNLFAKTTSLRSLDGEAYINVRKGKIIPGYELSLSLAWHGEAKDSHGASLLNVDGTVDIPYISDENADEDPEVKVTVNDQGPIGNRIKDAVISKGKPLILDKVRVWVQAMARGGPVKDELDTKKVAPPPPSSSSAAATKATPSAAAPPAAKKEAKKEETKKGRKSISMTEKFNCRAKDLFEILMDENRWKGFTQSNARISKEVGGEFTIFDGSVTGTNLELQEGKLIVQRWRFGSWNDGVQSTVRLVFDEPEAGVTVVKLTHTDVPEEDRYGNATVVENTERGWRDLIFQRIRAVFGFGI